MLQAETASLLVMQGTQQMVTKCLKFNELHCVSKNVPTLASRSFDKHGLLLIIFG